MDMRSITYRFSWSHNRYELAAVFVVLCVFFASSVILFAVLVAWPLMTSPTADYEWRDWYPALWTAPFWGIVTALLFFRTSPRRNLLHLDDDGLTFTRMGKSHRWRWSDIPEFRLKKRRLDLVAIEFVSPVQLHWSLRGPPWSASRVRNVTVSPNTR